MGPSPRAPWLPSMAAGVREVPDLPGARGVRTFPDAEARPESDAGPVLLGRVGRGGALPRGHQQPFSFLRPPAPAWGGGLLRSQAWLAAFSCKPLRPAPGRGGAEVFARFGGGGFAQLLLRAGSHLVRGRRWAPHQGHPGCYLWRLGSGRSLTFLGLGVSGRFRMPKPDPKATQGQSSWGALEGGERPPTAINKKRGEPEEERKEE